MPKRTNNNVSNATAAKTGFLNQASRLALRSGIAAGAASIFSLLAPDAALASCT